MEIVYYKSDTGNFGDDLNEILWPALFPADVLDAPNVALVGIGSILSEQYAAQYKLADKSVFVLGTGAGYGRLPVDVARWKLLAVRGPLTGRLVARPELAATDAAALMATVPRLVRRAERQDEIMFMPHHRTTEGANWEAVARAAGLTYVDPAWSTDMIMERFAHAKLVVTEAMHGAIVADTMRIPWVPIGISYGLLPFKWMDWCLSLDLPYKPVWLPSSTSYEYVKRLRFLKNAKHLGLPTPKETATWDDPEALIADFHRRYGSSGAGKSSSAPRRKSSPGRARLRAALVATKWPHSEIAASALRKAAASRAYLSADSVLQRRVEQLQAATDTLIRDVRAG